MTRDEQTDAPNGDADWIIHDIRINGETIMSVANDLPGDMFRTKAIDGFVSHRPISAGDEVEVIALYVDLEKSGTPATFHASLSNRPYQ